MNSGAEAVETAIKVARKWGYLVKGVHESRANIVAMEGNFHGRTTTIVSFSTDSVATQHYAPYTPGFRLVPYGDIEALRAAVDQDTVAVLLEPIQGEGGVIIPPHGFLRDVRTLCNSENVLMLADEIQSGLARTGRTFACDHEDVVPDMYILGKALGGGLYPVSAVAANGDVLEVITPGSHGSTFGGNPLAAAIGHEVVSMLETGEFQARAEKLGAHLAAGLEPLVGNGLEAVRVRGLWAGIDIDPGLATGRDVTESLLERRHPRQGGARPDRPARAAAGGDRGGPRPAGGVVREDRRSRLSGLGSTLGRWVQVRARWTQRPTAPTRRGSQGFPTARRPATRPTTGRHRPHPTRTTSRALGRWGHVGGPAGPNDPRHPTPRGC